MQVVNFACIINWAWYLLMSVFDGSIPKECKAENIVSMFSSVLIGFTNKPIKAYIPPEGSFLYRAPGYGIELGEHADLCLTNLLKL